MKDWEKFRALGAAIWWRGAAWESGSCRLLSRSIIAPIACINRPIRAFLSWVGIEDIRRRDISSVCRRIVPVVVGWPCPKRSPGGPAESPAPSPTESHAPAATTPSESPTPVPAGPSPSALPTAVPPTPVIAVPSQIARDQAGAVERGGFGRARDLSAWCCEGMPPAVGYRRVIGHAGRPCRHRGSTGAGHGTPRCLATYSPRVAGCELMPAGRCVAGGATFPRPGTSGICAAWADGTSARPRRRSPTAVRGSAPMIAATVTASVETAIGTAATVETSTGASVRASSAARVTTAMLGEGGCAKEYESKGRGS